MRVVRIVVQGERPIANGRVKLPQSHQGAGSRGANRSLGITRQSAIEIDESRRGIAIFGLEPSSQFQQAGIARLQGQARLDVGHRCRPVSGTMANPGTNQVGGCRLRGHRDGAARLVFGLGVAQAAQEHAL